MSTAMTAVPTSTRSTRCVTVSVPLIHPQSGYQVGKDETDPLATLANFFAIRHHSVALIGPGMLGVIAHDAAEVKSQGLERRGAREYGR